MSRRTLSHYEILEKIGEGGMGVVYRAVDTRLGRQVALKLLPPRLVADPERRERLAQEARTASALNHPHIVTIYEIDRAPSEDGMVDFIAMEYLEGEPLDQKIPDEGLPVEEALDWAIEVASACAAAHDAGVVHRDLKPSNLMIDSGGRLKVLDFGLAKLTRPADTVDAEAPTMASPALTQKGAVLGTPVYMSPEQAEGREVDARSDVYALGIVLYEMLAGRRPFPENSGAARRETAPPSLGTARPGIPEDLEQIVRKCLRRDPADRYPTAIELEEELRAVRARLAAAPFDLKAYLRRPRVLIPAAVVLTVLLVGGVWLWHRGREARWARRVALPEIERLIEEDDLAEAYRLAREAEHEIPGDPHLERLWKRFTIPVSIRTQPTGAQIAAKPYLAVDEPWVTLGRSPIEEVLLPETLHRFRIAKEGYETIEVAPTLELGHGRLLLEATLWPAGSAPEGMVRVPAGSTNTLSGQLPARELDAFWIDRHEVTNSAFQEFVDDGGYRRPELWKHALVRDGETLGREEALDLFRDKTGRPGPATWELGAHPEGQGDLPVGGVSWHEAAAYAEWAGKSLPTIHHWLRAADPSYRSDILLVSNFSGEGPAPVGRWQGLGPYGTYDMAGNLKEWSSTATGERRYLLGGAWNDPTYLFLTPEADTPFAREPTHGFRCVVYPEPLPSELTGPVEMARADVDREDPVSDEVFAVLESVYDYDETPLNARVESVDDSPPHWRLEEISFDAAYGDERVPVYLFLPENAVPPYQAVVYFPTSMAEALDSSDHLELRWFDFILRSGRAVIHPVYKGTYERKVR
ncbi:MAG: bifunctional serine/threonine-protein kinase/formylglycine-generating enzyme family protein, partial [Thermoanaerobaculia bacterium]|nr:bifunctional serine/threonine-protein kinase/formylglycine-generating enzyme family protein [Thermoanaerobaculia bacterium]